MKKYRSTWPSIISITLNEEISPYIKEIQFIEREKTNLELPVEDYFEKLKQNEKEKMIDIKANALIESETDEESESIDDYDKEIKKIINKPNEIIKDLIRGSIKELIKDKLEKRKNRGPKAI